MATIKLTPSTCVNAAGTSYLTITNPENACTDTDSTNYALIRNITQSTSNRYIYLRGFDFDEVPDDAIINSFDIKVKGYYTSGYSQVISLCNNTTTLAATATSFNTSVNTRTFNTGTLDYDTISGYGDNLGIRINCRRNSRSTTATYYIYGAEINVDYSIPVYHTVSSTAITGVVAPSGSTNILEGSSYTVTISDVDDPVVTDNGVDVTSSLVASSNATITHHPTSYTSTTFTVADIENAYTDINSDTRATLTLGGSRTGVIYLNFDSFDIPGSAVISGVSCLASLGIGRNGSSSGMTAECQLYSNTTAKGTATTVVSSATDVSLTTFTLTPGAWTANELNNARLYITMHNGARSTNRNLYIYGAEMSVTYESDGLTYTYTINSVTGDHTIIVDESGVPTNKIYIKENGSWKRYTLVYVKLNGTWVEQSISNWPSVFNTLANYVKG